MNRDSRNRGPGRAGSKSAKGKRIVRSKAEEIPKLTAAPSPDLEPPSAPNTQPYTQSGASLTREQIRELALSELANAAIVAAKELGQEAKSRGKRERGSGSRDALRKWLLETVFDRVAAPSTGVDAATQGVPVGVPPDELAERRRLLRASVRAHRRDMYGSGKD